MILRSALLILCCAAALTAEARQRGPARKSSAQRTAAEAPARKNSAPRTAATGSAGDVRQAPQQQAPQQQAPQPPAARMVLPVAAHDFGEVPRRGGDLRCEFVFRNEGTAPLVVLRVVTSCSCLKASFPKRPVVPGGEGVIRIVYEPHKSEPGAFNKVLQVYSNSAGGREILTVRGCAVEQERNENE